MKNFLSLIAAKAGINVGTGSGAGAGDIKASGSVLATTAASGYLSFAPYAVLPNNIAANTDPFTGAPGVNATFRRWHQWAMVNGTNNATNYWRITLISLGGVTIATLNTSGLTATQWGVLSVIGLSAAAVTTTMYLVRVAKVGSPAPLFLGTPAVYVE